MKTKKKSKGLLQYESDLEAIRERIKRGEITDEKNVMSETIKAFERASLDMTKKELRVFLAIMLSGHAAASSVLAAEGYPVPGNDPKQPN